MTVKERTSAREKVIEASKKYSTKLRSRLYRDTLKGSKAPDMDKDRQPASGSKATRRELSDAVNQAIKHFSGKEIYANQYTHTFR